MSLVSPRVWRGDGFTGGPRSSFVFTYSALALPSQCLHVGCCLRDPHHGNVIGLYL
jgi:hypothetical protein